MNFLLGVKTLYCQDITTNSSVYILIGNEAKKTICTVASHWTL